jgi:hypothetical protein
MDIDIEEETAITVDKGSQSLSNEAEGQDYVDFSAEEENWREYRKSETLFYVQTAIISVIVLACLINISLQNGDMIIWGNLLSTSIGILLPQPSFPFPKNKRKIKKKNLLSEKPNMPQ